jgi:uncharacterized membrane protein YdbT with pleckstrin-like domain
MDRFVESQVKLGPNEKFIAYWRQSVLVLGYRSALPALVAIGLLIAFVFATRLPTPVRGAAFGLIVVAGIVTLASVTSVILEWYLRIFVLTNRRLIRREGFIRQSRMEAQLVKIQDTIYRFVDIEKWLGLGRVIAETASAGPDLTIDYVRGAAAIAEEILSAAEAAKQEIARLDEERARQLLSERITTRM